MSRRSGDPVESCFDMDPLSLDGQIQRASIHITGEALRCTPYDEAQSIEYGVGGLGSA